MSDNPLGLTDEDCETLHMIAIATGWSVESVERAILNFTQIVPKFAVADPFWEPPTEPPTPDEKRKRAHERSKADRRRKSRKGKYKWGGTIDE